MRTRPLPNRHAYELQDFTECVQATLNRNRRKLPLDKLSALSLFAKLCEETLELLWAIALQSARQALRGSGDFVRVEREAQDVCVVLLGMWIWARGKALGGKGESSAQSSTSSRVKEWKERGGVL